MVDLFVIFVDDILCMFEMCPWPIEFPLNIAAAIPFVQQTSPFLLVDLLFDLIV